MNLLYLWLIPLAFLWSALHGLVFLVRFGRFPDGGAGEVLVFVPMGVVSGGLLVWLLGQARSRGRKASTVAGYVVAAPFAFIGSLLGGLVLDPLVGTLLLGALPLLLGTAAGYRIGKRWDHER